MNKIKVKCMSEKLMRRADKEFDVVTHMPDEENQADYCGEFIVLDSRPEEDIISKVKDIHEQISHTIV